ncbi:MAG: adenylate kinase [Candidatus Omnitrophica bacterium]|nr:adenylate kinase [Candidatus Omnitrophota bacterium]
MKLVLLGPPGAGKGTQAVELSAQYNIPHISTGDIFRKKIKDGSDIGKKAKSFVERGDLVPDEIVVAMVIERLQERDTAGGFILDGFPRTKAQAEALDRCLSDLRIDIDIVLNFDTTEDVIVKRLSGRRVCKQCGATYHIVNMPTKVEGICDKCGGAVILRKDDEEATIRNRIKVYNETAMPLKEYYKAKGLFVTIDASLDYKELGVKLEALFKDKIG